MKLKGNAESVVNLCWFLMMIQLFSLYAVICSIIHRKYWLAQLWCVANMSHYNSDGMCISRNITCLLSWSKSCRSFWHLHISPAIASRPSRTRRRKNLLSATGEHPNVLSCGGNNASDGFGFILGKLRLHNKYNDTPPPPSCAWTMFSVQTHYRKCKHLTECHSQGYCLSALLAAHLHGADQALKHDLPQKTSPAAIFRRAPCTAGE